MYTKAIEMEDLTGGGVQEAYSGGIFEVVFIK
jgi:hypothetical protein